MKLPEDQARLREDPIQLELFRHPSYYREISESIPDGRITWITEAGTVAHNGLRVVSSWVGPGHLSITEIGLCYSSGYRIIPYLTATAGASSPL